MLYLHRHIIIAFLLHGLQPSFGFGDFFLLDAWRIHFAVHLELHLHVWLLRSRFTAAFVKYSPFALEGFDAEVIEFLFEFIEQVLQVWVHVLGAFLLTASLIDVPSSAGCAFVPARTHR
jgi:hypothetical protein